jgi:AbiTii-like protein
MNVAARVIPPVYITLSLLCGAQKRHNLEILSGFCPGTGTPNTQLWLHLSRTFKKTFLIRLRTAKVISAKLGLSDIEEWIAAELSGYPNGKPVPDYRHAVGTLQAYNPYHGWITVTGGSIEMPFGHSISQIEEFSKQERMDFSPKTDVPLPDVASSFVQRVVFSGIVFKGMIEAVRERLLDWSLELEKRGITGENMSFDEQEKQAARNQIFNIQNFTGVLGDVSHSNVNVYDFNSIHQELKNCKVPQSERNELENILDALKSAPSEEKPNLIEKGKAWIVKNQEILGAGANIVRQALGIPNVA